MTKQVIRQRDFSGGQVVAHAKRRDDEAVVRASARQLENMRVLPSGAVKPRPGRTARFLHTGIVESVRMSATTEYKLCFGNGSLTIRDTADAVVTTQAGYAWTPATVKDIVWDVFGNDVFMCFPGQIVKVARWDGGTGWTFLDYAPTVTAAGRRLTPFFRFAPAGVTMSLSALTGAGVTVTFSAAVLSAGHVGSRFRYYDRQIEITGFTSSTIGTATVSEILREIKSIDFVDVVTDQFAVGDIIEGETTGARRYLAEVGTPGTDDVTWIRLNSIGASGNMIGPNGEGTISAVNSTLTTGPAISVWDEEVMSAFRGYPRSVTVDQNRLIFCDFPGVPGGVAWSQVGDPFDLNIGPDPDNGFFEVVPSKSRVYHVRPGADEFIFTDLGIYYIPISTSNPLRPGSVDFRRIPGPPSSRVEPVSTSQGLVYVGGGLNRVLAIVGTGQTAQPYIIRPVSELHSDLFNGIICLEVEEGSGDPPDDRVYAVNGDGTVAVGRYQPGKEWVGWVPWSGSGQVKWVSALGDAVLVSTTYTAASVCEELDPATYLDCGVLINAIPTAVGTLALFNGATVDLMDGVQFLGSRAVAAAAIVTQAGDDFSALTVMAGYKFDLTIEPFIPHVQAGQSVGQTMQPRQSGRFAVAVQDSTGFRAQQWNPNGEFWKDQNDVASAYRAGENQDIAPPLREEVKVWPALGTEFDPRFRIVKDYPGPLTVLEISTEIGS